MEAMQANCMPGLHTLMQAAACQPHCQEGKRLGQQHPEWETPVEFETTLCT